MFKFDFLFLAFVVIGGIFAAVGLLERADATNSHKVAEKNFKIFSENIGIKVSGYSCANDTDYDYYASCTAKVDGEGVQGFQCSTRKSEAYSGQCKMNSAKKLVGN